MAQLLRSTIKISVDMFQISFYELIVRVVRIYLYLSNKRYIASQLFR